MKMNLLDRAIGYFDPARGAKRVRSRAAIEVMQRSYNGASRGRLNGEWHRTANSADGEIGQAAAFLRDSMRDLVRNNPHAANAVEVLVSHVIGTGIIPRANTGDPKKDKKINALFERFSKKCDADGQLDFYGLQSLTFRGMVESGDGIVRRRRRRKEDNLPVPLQYQVIETDLLDGMKQGVVSDGRTAIQGIEFDALGTRTAYWMFSEHPGNAVIGLNYDRISKAIPASEIAHVYRKLRTQVRGVPWGSPVITSLFDLGTYEEAEIIRKKLEACMVGVVIGGDDADFALGAALNANGDGERSFGSVRDADGAIVEKFEPGMFVHAEGGKDVKFNQPAATGSYEGYKKASLHTIAAGFHIPYMLLTGDLSGANYASSKMGFGPFNRLIETVQWLCVIPMLLQPMWDWFVEAAYLQGAINMPTVPVTWMTPRMYSADPEKDARATILEVRNGLKPLSAAIGERGFDADEVFDEYAKTNKKVDDLKLVFDSDPRKQSANGQKQQAPGEGGDDPPPE